MRYALLLLLLAPAFAFAQGTGTLTGRVVEDTGEGLPGANVIIDGTTLGAATDVDGYYRIVGVPVDTYTVTASFIGFAPVTRTGIEVGSDYTPPLDFNVGGEVDLDMITIEECFHPLVDTDPFVARAVVRGGSCGFSVAFDHSPLSR